MECESLFVSGYQIVKMSYSSKPWRVVTVPCPLGEGHSPSGCRNGCELYRDEVFDHPNLGQIVIAGPVAFDRKRDAVVWLTAQRAA